MALTPGNDSHEKRMLTLWILWAAMLGSLFAYVFICHRMGDRTSPLGPDFPLALLRNILMGIAAVTLILTRFIRRLMLAERTGDAPPAAPGALPASIDPAVYARYTTAMLVALAFSESIGIYGVVLFFLGDSFHTLYIFTGISAAAMLFYRPKNQEIEALARKATRPGPY